MWCGTDRPGRSAASLVLGIVLSWAPARLFADPTMPAPAPPPVTAAAAPVLPPSQAAAAAPAVPPAPAVTVVEATAPEPIPPALTPLPPLAEPVVAPAAAADAAVRGGLAQAGLIFDAAAPLGGLQSYQGGLGMKVSFHPHAVRGLLDLQYASNGSFALNLGAVYEYHFLRSPVSPYLGVEVTGGYLDQAPTALLVPVTAGVVVGAEVYILDYLSVFVEYGVSASWTRTIDLQSQASTDSFSAATGMGNQGMIGVVVYFPASRQ